MVLGQIAHGAAVCPVAVALGPATTALVCSQPLTVAVAVATTRPLPSHPPCAHMARAEQVSSAQPPDRNLGASGKLIGS